MHKYINDYGQMVEGVKLILAGTGKCVDSLSDEGVNKLKEIGYNVAPKLLNRAAGHMTRPITDFFNNKK